MSWTHETLRSPIDKFAKADTPTRSAAINCYQQPKPEKTSSTRKTALRAVAALTVAYIQKTTTACVPTAGACYLVDAKPPEIRDNKAVVFDPLERPTSSTWRKLLIGSPGHDH